MLILMSLYSAILPSAHFVYSAEQDISVSRVLTTLCKITTKPTEWRIEKGAVSNAVGISSQNWEDVTHASLLPEEVFRADRVVQAQCTIGDVPNVGIYIALNFDKNGREMISKVVLWGFPAKGFHLTLDKSNSN